MNYRNKVDALNRDRMALKKKRRFTWIVGDQRKTMVQKRQKVRKSQTAWFIGPKVSKASGKNIYFDEIAV